MSTSANFTTTSSPCRTSSSSPAPSWRRRPKFVIPGGTTLSAHLDVARTIIRRAERKVVKIQLDDELASGEILRFLNRASDLCFAMARFADVEKPELFEGRRKPK